jgi:hypothetical protein
MGKYETSKVEAAQRITDRAFREGGLKLKPRMFEAVCDRALRLWEASGGRAEPEEEFDAVLKLAESSGLTPDEVRSCRI